MSVFIIFFMRQNFKMFPTEIMEAARVDGASEFSIFLRIVTPSMQATYASAAIYLFLGQWNSYLWPLDHHPQRRRRRPSRSRCPR